MSKAKSPGQLGICVICVCDTLASHGQDWSLSNATVMFVHSIHAESLPSDVLQSVVDLLWNQLNSMTALLTSTDDVSPSKGLDEAQLQCK